MPPPDLKSGGGACWAGNERAPMQAQTPIAPTAPAPDPLVLRIWPLAMVALGLGLTAIWISLLGYGLVTLIGVVI